MNKIVHTLEQLADNLKQATPIVGELREQRNARYQHSATYPQGLAEHYTRAEYFQRLMQGHDMTQFYEKNPVWLFRSDHFAIKYTAGIADYLFVNNNIDLDPRKEAWCFTHSLPDQPYKVAVTMNPMVRFCMNLRHHAVSLRFNQTGHFRGVWSVGPQMIENVLLNDHNWYMQSQKSLVEDCAIWIDWNCLYEYRWANDFHAWVQELFEQDEDHNMLRLISDYLCRINPWDRLYRDKPMSTTLGTYNHFVDRHPYMEETAWGYFQQHPELKQLLHERYAQDYEMYHLDVGIEDIDTYELMWRHIEGWGSNP